MLFRSRMVGGRGVLTWLVVSVAVASMAAAQTPSRTVTISLVATTDLHGAVLPRGDRGGVALLRFSPLSLSRMLHRASIVTALIGKGAADPVAAVAESRTGHRLSSFVVVLVSSVV